MLGYTFSTPNHPVFDIVKELDLQPVSVNGFFNYDRIEFKVPENSVWVKERNAEALCNKVHTLVFHNGTPAFHDLKRELEWYVYSLLKGSKVSLASSDK